MAAERVGMSGRNFDAFVSGQRRMSDRDWAAKIQEKYWLARQKFLSKVEKKEDSCIVLSDSKLDAKLEIYRSIEKSCARLANILESYQNSLFVFANEENALGILLKECGKHDKTNAGKIMSITGKSLTQSSHQRIRLYMPLLRFHQEMETFHLHAVGDTSNTVDKLETRRCQYRASLLWMKSISERLDPDIYGQLDKFRCVQSQVREDKRAFDCVKMDVDQKIDLIMASRCNLMNQILAPYQAILLETFEKNCNNFKSVEEILKREDIYEYEFQTLKQLNSLKLSDSPPPPPPTTDCLENKDTTEGAAATDRGKSDSEPTPSSDKPILDLLLDVGSATDDSSNNNNNNNDNLINLPNSKNTANLGGESFKGVSEIEDLVTEMKQMVGHGDHLSMPPQPVPSNDDSLINLMPEEGASLRSTAAKDTSGRSNVDLLTDELEAIDNSSYFKSLQQLQL